MKKAIYSILILCIFIFCAPALKDLPREEREKITTKIFDYEYNKVFFAVMTVLENNEYVVTNTDKDVGLINTDYRAKHSILIGHYRTKFNVRMKKLSKNACQVKLNPVMEIKEYGSWVRQTMTTRRKREFDKFFVFIQEELERQP